jgi:DNA-binding FrmR family transcriptional regulator
LKWKIAMTNLTDETRKKALVMRLKRIEGQLRGIQNLIESGADCEAVAQQMSASRKALDKAFFTLVGCVISQGEIEGDDIATMLAKFA